MPNDQGKEVPRHPSQELAWIDRFQGWYVDPESGAPLCELTGVDPFPCEVVPLLTVEERHLLELDESEFIYQTRDGPKRATVMTREELVEAVRMLGQRVMALQERLRRTTDLVGPADRAARGARGP